MNPAPCPCGADDDPGPLETLLKLAKTKAELQDVVRMLHHRNQTLQRVRDNLGIQLAQAGLSTPSKEPRR